MAEQKSILYFLTNKKRASPFDLIFAYDTGFDVIVRYESLATDEVEQIVEDAMFPRGPGMKGISFWIGGDDVQWGKETLKKAKGKMFPPFQAPIMIDPVGAYTTGASMGVKAVHEAKEIFDTIEGKEIVILGGTGQVGRVAAMVSTKEGLDVTIAETYFSLEKAQEIAEGLEEEIGAPIRAIKTPSEDQEAIYDAIKDADIIFATGPEGIQLIEEETVERLEGKKLLVDINAVPPLGIEAVETDADMDEIQPGIWGIGAQTVGQFKNKVQKELLTELKTADKGTIDYMNAYEKGKELIS